MSFPDAMKESNRKGSGNYCSEGYIQVIRLVYT